MQKYISLFMLLGMFALACKESATLTDDNKDNPNTNNPVDTNITNPVDTSTNNPVDTNTTTNNGLPKFVEVQYIELEKIQRISKFRSGVGHSYADDFESCRSMKHYFQPKDNVDWSTVKLFSPVDGTVVREFNEWAGKQIQIQSFQHPEFVFIIFHLVAANPIALGDTFSKGQFLGTHISDATMSDIAVNYNTPEGRRLVSYFDVMTDSLFQRYVSHGVTSRSDMIISGEVRNASPLQCNGETFSNEGTLTNWFDLQ